MKSLYSFFALIILMLILGACSDSSTGPDDSFQSQRFGNWLTTSETSAKWVGSGQNVKGTTQMAAVGDTIYFDKPDGNELSVSYMSGIEETEFRINYSDNRYNEAFFDTTEASDDFITISPFKGVYLGTNGYYDVNTRQRTLYISIKEFSCDSTYNESEYQNFEFHLLKDSFDVQQVADDLNLYDVNQLLGLYEAYEYVIINTKGIEDVMRSMACPL